MISYTQRAHIVSGNSTHEYRSARRHTAAAAAVEEKQNPTKSIDSMYQV